MGKLNRTTSIVPYGADREVYVVVDDFGHREREIERPDLESVVADLLSGQFHDPIRVLAFNTLEHWSNDLSGDVALQIQSRCDSDGSDVPPYLAGFMEIHIAPLRRLRMRDQESRRRGA